MKVCVVGAGHIGTTLTCYIKHAHPEHFVALFSRKADVIDRVIRCNDVEKKTSYFVRPDVVSNDSAVAVANADLIFIAIPHFAVEKTFQDIAPYVKKDAFVGVIPGGGGCEFFFNRYFKANQTLFGFQRVPFTAKLSQYGKETNLKSWKPYNVVAALQGEKTDDVCELIELCGLNTKKASNYLEIALTPTNPLLHTARIYELFGQYDRNYGFDEKKKFYVGWTDKASRVLFLMDHELHRLLDAIGRDETSAIRWLSEHYESPTIADLTKKINSISSFQSVYAPLKMINGAFYADLDSRMFQEDFPWGLLVIRSYFDYFGITAPMMDEVLSWYADYMGLDWFNNGKLVGKDLVHTGAVQNYGIVNKKDLLSYYQLN